MSSDLAAPADRQVVSTNTQPTGGGIGARLRRAFQNSGADGVVMVSTDGRNRGLSIPAKGTGSGSAVNGGEFL